jgi:hypothetical protein
MSERYVNAVGTIIMVVVSGILGLDDTRPSRLSAAGLAGRFYLYMTILPDTKNRPGIFVCNSCKKNEAG